MLYYLCESGIRKARLEDAISITPYIRSEAEDVRGGLTLTQMRLEDATLLLDCKGLYRNGHLAVKVASSRRLVGWARRVPAHPSLALSMYGVIERASSRRVCAFSDSFLRELTYYLVLSGLFRCP